MEPHVLKSRRPVRDRLEILLAGLLLCGLVLVSPRVEESDAVEYFSYLHSIWMDRDLDFTNEYTYFYRQDPAGRQGFKETFLDRETPTGLKNNFGPVGTALLWAPFYLLAHGGVLVAKSLGASVSPDGLSLPYRWAVTLASALYASIGLLLSYRLARRYADAEASFLAVVALWWATPVAYYMYVAPGMSHAASLFAAALFFTLWPWAQSGSTGRWIVWGAAAGLMALVREQDGLLAVAALLAVGSSSWEVPGRLTRLVAFGVSALCVFSPQLLVYQILYGRPAPSPHVENKMYWSSPHSLSVLFSPEHGLVFWTPVLFVFLAGAVILLRRHLNAGLILLASFLSQVYISGAVDSWTTAGAFGARRFVATTVIFAVWGALVLEVLRPRLRRVGTYAAVGFFVLWNVSLMVQFGLGLMDRQRLVWREVIHNQVYEVPPRIVSVVARYFTDREDLSGEREEP
jgi:Dolichyl-phosphate-mannose-protein mannosyltransferase